MADANLFKKGVAVCDDTFLLKVTKDKLKAVIAPQEEDGDGIGDVSTINSASLAKDLKTFEVVSGVLDKPIPKGNGLFVVAEGRAAVNGENAKFKTHVKPCVVRSPKSRKKGDDNVDFRELGTIVNVSKDRILIEKIPPTPGDIGEDVFGEPLKPKPGKDQAMKVGSGVELSEDGLKATSLVDGKFMLADGKASVLTEHSVMSNVDMTVGNVAFVGEKLEVNGTVHPGFKIKCKGDVYISQGVENSEVMSGGNLVIKGGVIGEEVVLQSWGNVTADFVENIGKIEARGSLTITDSIIQANVKVGQNVTVLQGKGTLIGGKFVVGGSVHVKELGSDAEVVTELLVGINPELEEKKKKLDADKEIWPVRMSDNLRDTTALKKMQKEEGKNFPPEKLAQLKKLVADLPKVMEKTNEITEREEAMGEEMAKSVGECVFVYGTVFPGVSVSIGSKTRVLINEERWVVIHFEKESQKIKFRTMTPAERSVVE